MPAVSFKATGTAPEDTPWNWSAATQNAVLGDSDDPNWDRYKAAHAWTDGEDGAKSHYKLPHHRMGDNGLEAVWHGVTAAMARLSGTDLPESDMRDVFNHLARHYDQWGKEAPEWDRFWADVQTRRAQEQAAAQRAPALVSALRERTVTEANANAADSATDAALAQVPATRLPGEVATRAPIIAEERPNGRATDDDMAYINRQARRELSPDDVYVIPTESSNESVDAYFTRMTPQTLANFAEDATSGVAFCDSHRHDQLPIGRTFYGRVDTVERADGSTMQAAHLLSYMLRGLKLSNGMTSDDIIRGVEGGVYQDVSVGFKPLRYTCSICGRDMLSDWQCMHWPGQTYEDDDGVERMCIANVDARLAEHSLVYEGATPNAMTLKAERELALGRASARQLLFVEQRTGIRLLERWTGWGAGEIAHPPAAPSYLTVTSANHTTPLDAPRAALASSSTGVQALTPDPWDALEEENMRGSELLERFMAEYAAVAERSGKEISASNMQKLRDMHSQLANGHDSMREGLEMMARFLDEKNGDNEPPDSEEGNGQKGEEDAAKNEDGDEQPGASDSDDAHKPGASRAAEAETDASATERKSGATPPKPGTDDGDGDDDEPPAPTGKTEEDADAANAAEAENADDEPVEEVDDPDEPNNAADAEDGDGDAGAEGKTTPAAGGKGKSAHGSGRDGDGATITRLLASASLSDEERELLEEARAFRADTIEEALQAGVRALGAEFKPELYRGLLERASIAQIKAMRANWQTIARQALSPRGRWVEDPENPAGGHYTTEPTGEGGRQTIARDPSDPIGVRGAQQGRNLAPGARLSRPTSADPALYSLGASPRRTARSR